MHQRCTWTDALTDRRTDNGSGKTEPYILRGNNNSISPSSHANFCLRNYTAEQMHLYA